MRSLFVLFCSLLFILVAADVSAQCKQCTGTGCTNTPKDETGRKYCVSGSYSCTIWGDHCVGGGGFCECGTAGCGVCEPEACIDPPFDATEWVLASVHVAPRSATAEYQLVAVRIDVSRQTTIHRRRS